MAFLYASVSVELNDRAFDQHNSKSSWNSFALYFVPFNFLVMFPRSLGSFI